MTDPGNTGRLRARVRVMQLICSALVLGVLLFLGVAVYLVLSQGRGLAPPAADLPIVSMLALVMLLTNGSLALFLPGIVANNAIQKIASGSGTPPNPRGAGDDEATLMAVRQTSLIIGLALWEGVAFMSVIAFLLEGDPLVLAVAGVAILFMLGRFPTMSNVQAWLERQQSLLNELRQQRG